MSAVVSDAPPVLPPGGGSDKKSKKAKREHKTKKRDRDPETAVDDGSERKSKKARQAVDADAGDDRREDSGAVGAAAPAVNGTAHATDGGKKKKKKEKKIHQAEETEDVPVVPADAAMDVVESEVPPSKKEKKSKKSKSQPEAEVETQATTEEPTKKKKRERKSKDHEAILAAQAEAAAIEEHKAANGDADAMDIDSTPVAKKTKKPSTSKTSKSSTKVAGSTLSSSSADRTYPFYTQTVSLYLPLYPAGMTEPLEGYADQHLKQLVNRYVPDLKGILLAYRNPRLGERPGAKSLTEQSGMEDVALLESIAEYAVGYGWFTAEVDIFRPTRGAWMEGKINLQSEGFVGVICFDMFNASIEASRLPQGWRWVDMMSSSSSASGKKGASSKPASDPFDEDENDNNDKDQEQVQETEQLHQTGYWVDATGARVTGNLPFRIKNYEVGSSETHGYLSIEGTMLSEEDEVAKVLDEREEARRRKKRLAGGYPQRQIKRIPDFATTKFAVAPLEQDEEDEAQRAAQYKGTVEAGEDSD
ncbi:uncharacterized protein B0I36DRAFT_328953 [Microdochium trichocladiopsis]|uniref:DNA-directed RNA polymerase subunit n=1 Tax=Microdochium trichocladiopsis TaxID=1682393 RepID=A0A9P9BQB7_9PEZI|nr:uncharacterized protein B0I36DRAFT_328953 [Microdochium trichocladiopsis]KAH7025707.1 hypothetical protein B0I36DRAFT_328953 [Microdochium trichocladiopsis]